MTVLPFSAEELQQFRATQQSAMQDRCIILRYRESGTDAYGSPLGDYEETPAIPCGVALLQPREVQGESEVPIISARIRLPLGTPIAPQDIIRIIRRYQEEVAPEEYEVIGPVSRGPSGIIAIAQLRIRVAGR